MRIAMISEHASPSAPAAQLSAPMAHVSAQVAQLSAALAEQGHEVRIYTRRDSPDLPAITPLGERVNVVHVPVGPSAPVASDVAMPHLGEFGRWLVRDWRDGDWAPAVAHAHFWTSGLAAVTAARQCRIPVVQTFHSLGSPARAHRRAAEVGSPQRSSYERTLARVVDRVVAQSQDEVGELLRLGVPRAQLSVVPPGVDLDRFCPDGPASRRDLARARVLTVSHSLAEHTGVGDVVQSMRYVPGAECVVLGGPPSGQLDTDPRVRDLRALAEQHAVADRVRFLGEVPPMDLSQWYRSTDLLVAAGWFVPSSFAALEAMACGVPVVGSAAGGLADTVIDGLTGDLVPARDPRLLGAALRRLLNDNVRRFAYATAALDRARQCYSFRRVAAQLSAVYAAVAGARRSGELRDGDLRDGDPPDSGSLSDELSDDELGADGFRDDGPRGSRVGSAGSRAVRPAG